MEYDLQVGQDVETLQLPNQMFGWLEYGTGDF